MPILTYVTRVEVGEPAVLDAGTTYSGLTQNTFYKEYQTLYSTQHLVMGNNSTLDVTQHSTYSKSDSASYAELSWSWATTSNNSYTTLAKIVSYGPSGITFHSTFSQNVTDHTIDQGFKSVYTQADNDSYGATEVEAFGTVNNVLRYSFSRTSRGRQALQNGITGTTGDMTFSTTPGTTSSTSYTSSAGKFFRDTYRVDVSTTQNQTITERFVTSSSTRTHTLTYGDSYTFTSFSTTNLFSTFTLTVTYTSSSFPGSQSITVTQRVPVTTTRTTSRTVSSFFPFFGSHYHFSNNPQTVYGNLIVIDDLSTTAQRLAVGPSTTGYQYASQFLAVGTSFSFVYGQVGSSTFGQPSGSTGSLTLVHDSYAATSTGEITYGRLVGLNTQGGFQTLKQSIFTTRAVLTPVTFTQTTGQSFATQSTSSSVVGASSRSTTYGYVTFTGASTLSSTLAKTLWEALGTATSSRTMRLLASTTSNTTASRSFTLGSTAYIAQNTASTGSSESFTSVAHGTVNRAFYVRTTSFSEHAPDVPALRFSQEVLMGAFIASPSDSVAYNSMNLPLIFLLSTYTPHDAGDFSFPGGMIPLAGSAVYNSSYYTQAYSISSNSTSLSFTYRAVSAATSQTSTSSHVRTMGASVAKMTLHHNDYAAPVDTTALRSFPSGTGGAYSTGGSEAARFETPSFIASAIHATVGLNGTAGYNLEHDLVYGSGTAGSIRNAGTATSSFPVSRSVASQRLFYGNRISTAAVAFSDAAPAFSEVTINPMVTVAPL